LETLCYFLIRARPTPECSEFMEIGGAYVCCWVAHKDLAIAEQIARDAIAEESWNVETVEESFPVSRDRYEGDESLEYFERALRDGHALVFHTWPMGCEDDVDETP
jgi:hypothetical protein